MDYGNYSLDTSTNVYKRAHISKTLSFASRILYQYLVIRIKVIITISEPQLVPEHKGYNSHCVFWLQNARICDDTYAEEDE